MSVRRLLVALAAGGALLLSSGSSFAQMEPEQPFVPSDNAVRPWEAGHSVTPWGMGELKGRAALTGNNRLIVVQPKSAAQTYVVGSTRFFDARGNRVPSDALRQGDEVKVDYDLLGNTPVARRVTILQHDPSAP
jgi:hypothetical protein